MKSKKIISGILAFTLAFGVCTAVPAYSENGAGMAIVASAYEDYKTVDGFVLMKDDEGRIFVFRYWGDGGDITIPKEATYIGDMAFFEDKSITSVTFPEGTTKYGIGGSAFLSCDNLKSVIIEGDVGGQGIASSAFLGCSLLKTVKFKKNNAHVSSIGVAAFEYCYSLTNINIPSDTEKICDLAFSTCAKLSEITIPKNTIVEGDNVFGYMCGFTSSEDYASPKVKPTVMKADGKKTIYMSLPGKSNNEAKKYAKEIIGDDSNVKTYNRSGSLFSCCPITPCEITLNVYKGSSAEKWAKENGIKYKIVSSSSSDTKKLSNLKASKTAKNSVTLSWDEENGASAYRVYKYNAKTKKYEKYKDVTSTTCKVTGLSSKTKYKFKVTALKKSGKSYKTGRSATISVTTK